MTQELNKWERIERYLLHLYAARTEENKYEKEIAEALQMYRAELGINLRLV